MNPFDNQVGGDHYKRFAFDPFKVCGNWPKWAGDVFTYLIRNKGADDYQKAMHTMAMWMDMDSTPQPQPLADELTRRWVEMSYDALDPQVTEVIIALGYYISAPREDNLRLLMESMYDLQESMRAKVPNDSWARSNEYLDLCHAKLMEMLRVHD